MDMQDKDVLFEVVRNERGSLALEQVLFIGAIVAMGVGLYAFYGDLSNYFSAFQPDASGVTGVGRPSFSVTP